MTRDKLFDILLNIPGGHRIYVREGLMVDHEQQVSIPTIWIAHHRQAERGFRKIDWIQHVPVGVFLMTTRMGHDELKRRTGGFRLLLEPKNTGWSPEEIETITDRAGVPNQWESE